MRWFSGPWRGGVVGQHLVAGRTPLWEGVPPLSKPLPSSLNFPLPGLIYSAYQDGFPRRYAGWVTMGDQTRQWKVFVAGEVGGKKRSAIALVSWVVVWRKDAGQRGALRGRVGTAEIPPAGARQGGGVRCAALFGGHVRPFTRCAASLRMTRGVAGARDRKQNAVSVSFTVLHFTPNKLRTTPLSPTVSS